jgi:hypothetical protein
METREERIARRRQAEADMISRMPQFPDDFEGDCARTAWIKAERTRMAEAVLTARIQRGEL